MSVRGCKSDTIEGLEEACKDQESPDTAGHGVNNTGVGDNPWEKDPGPDAVGGQEKGSGW